MPNSVPIVIGICGGSGSGKTTLAKELFEHFEGDAVILCQDSYYQDKSSLPETEIQNINFDHPGSIDWKLLNEHIRSLLKDRRVKVPVYDYITHSRIAEKEVSPASKIIIEGHLIFNNESIRNLIDLKVFIDIDMDLMLARRIIRDTMERGRSVESVLEQYLTTVKPMYLEYVKPSKDWAHRIISSKIEFSNAANIIANDYERIRMTKIIDQQKDKQC